MIRAARYLGVPPWELQSQSMWWQRVAMEAEAAEAAAEEYWRRHPVKET